MFGEGSFEGERGYDDLRIRIHRFALVKRIGSGAEGSKEEIEIRDVRHANLHLVVATHHEALLDHLIEDDIFLFEVFFEAATSWTLHEAGAASPTVINNSINMIDGSRTVSVKLPSNKTILIVAGLLVAVAVLVISLFVGGNGNAIKFPTGTIDLLGNGPGGQLPFVVLETDVKFDKQLTAKTGKAFRKLFDDYEPGKVYGIEPYGKNVACDMADLQAGSTITP
ncbi:MAG: hypothetical protein SGPRY_004701, partial [Prymnesium sp.]